VRVLLSALLTLVYASAASTAEPAQLFTGVLTSAASTAESAQLSSGMLESAAYPSVPDTTTNKALEEMLAQFVAGSGTAELAYDSWTLTAHRYLGFAIVAATGAQVVLGSITWDQRKRGKEPSTLDAHKYLGYSIAGTALAQSLFGYYNFWKMRDRSTGKGKRWIHLTLSSLATAGFVAAAVIANNSRNDIEDGTAALEKKTFDDLYGNHRSVAIWTTASVLLTVTVIVW